MHTRAKKHTKPKSFRKYGKGSVRQGISTVYHGPTNSRGARIIATSGGGIRKSFPWDYDLDTAANHEKAAYALAYGLGWIQNHTTQYLRGGSTPKGYCWVFVK